MLFRDQPLNLEARPLLLLAGEDLASDQPSGAASARPLQCVVLGYEVTNPVNLQGVVLTKTHKHTAVNLVRWDLIKYAGTQNGQGVRRVCIVVEPVILADRWLSEFQGFPLLPLPFQYGYWSM